MSASDIKAGGAYIEIGAISKAFDTTLASVHQKLEGLASTVGKIGFGLTAMGAAFTAPAIAAAHHYAQTGAEIEKLHSKTGMGYEGLAAIGAIAARTEVPMQAVGRAVKNMQLSITNGSGESRAALLALGVNFDELKSKTPEQKLGVLADALNNVTDEGQKMMLGTKMFGGAFQAVMPVLEEGSAGFNSAADAAARAGRVFDEEGAKKAGKLHEAFLKIGGAAEAVQNALASAFAQTLTDSLNRLTELINGAREWIATNPEIISNAFKIAEAIGAAGLVFTTMLIGSAALAITDSLEVTKTGFGQLFDSIRVGGQGLATWMTSFGTVPVDWIDTVGHTFMVAIMRLVSLVKHIPGLGGVGKGIEATANQWDRLYDQQHGARMAGVGNKLAADWQQTDSAVGFDKEKAMMGLTQIGDKISGVVAGLFDKIQINLPQHAGAGTNPFGEKEEKSVTSMIPSAQFTSVGSFSGYGGAMAATGILDQQLQTQKRTANGIEELVRHVRSSGGGLAGDR